MSDFNYKEYLKNNPLLQKIEVNEEKLITEAKTTTEEMSNPVMRKGEKGDDSIEKETEKMRMKEDDRTDAEQEGYKDGFEDAKDDIEGALKKMKVSELKAKIKEDIISLLQEDEVEYETPLEEKVDVDIDVEDKVSEDMGVGLLGSLILMIGSVGVGKVLDKIKDKYPEEVAKFNKAVGSAQRGSGKTGSSVGRFVTEDEEVSEDMGVGLLGSLIIMIGSVGVGKVLDKIKDKYPEEVAKFNKMAGAAQRGSGKTGSSAGRFVTEDEVEIDVEDEVEIEEPKLDASVAQTGLSDDEKQIQDALKLAYDNAVAIGDEKLSDQIGNSITFFTRTHVVER
tara:strand:- start:1758 stop:2768 length:1011 start_codon:yes stop_codon:yes gene_type:complete